MKKLVIATCNLGKVREFQEILGAKWEVLSTRDLGDVPEVIEDGETFQENACKKALAIAQLTKAPVIADDSGLEVEALNGAPGVYSARYAGESATDSDNNLKLLKALQGATDRRAQFRCVLAVAESKQITATYEGVCKGKIMETLSGEGGFGYDPLFVPEGESLSFAELLPKLKNAMSHRGKAIEHLTREHIWQ
ncbi:MAG: XTP/dITP diphosphatase [Verrucomicrobiota bacterium]